MKKAEKKETKKSTLKTLAAKKGFYIALLTMVMVIGTVAVVKKFTANISTATSTFDDEAWENAIAKANDEAKDLSESPRDDSKLYENILNSFEEDSKSTSSDLQDTLALEETVPASATVAEDAPLSFSLPCGEKVTKGYSPNKLIYSKTMKDWRTHSGIDIGAEKNSVVTAAESGVIEEVYEDKNLGVVVVIGHPQGIKSLYGNLLDISFIEVGRKVAKGDTIGAVGSSSLLEKNEESHIHFEIIKDGETQDPAEYLPI